MEVKRGIWMLHTRCLEWDTENKHELLHWWSQVEFPSKLLVKVNVLTFRTKPRTYFLHLLNINFTYCKNLTAQLLQTFSKLSHFAQNTSKSHKPDLIKQECSCVSSLLLPHLIPSTLKRNEKNKLTKSTQKSAHTAPTSYASKATHRKQASRGTALSARHAHTSARCQRRRASSNPTPTRARRLRMSLADLARGTMRRRPMSGARMTSVMVLRLCFISCRFALLMSLWLAFISVLLVWLSGERGERVLLWDCFVNLFLVSLWDGSLLRSCQVLVWLLKVIFLEAIVESRYGRGCSSER